MAKAALTLSYDKLSRVWFVRGKIWDDSLMINIFYLCCTNCMFVLSPPKKAAKSSIHVLALDDTLFPCIVIYARWAFVWMWPSFKSLDWTNGRKTSVHLVAFFPDYFLNMSFHCFRLISQFITPVLMWGLPQQVLKTGTFQCVCVIAGLWLLHFYPTSNYV